MERIHGSRLDALGDRERRRARKKLLRAFVRQILDHGVFHADPHPGNLLVDEEGRVVLLDLGAVDELPSAVKNDLGKLTRAVVLRRPRALADAVLALSIQGKAIDRPRLESDVMGALDAASGKATGADLVGRFLAISRTHALAMPAPLLVLMRAIAILDGVLRAVTPSANVVMDLRWEIARASVRWMWSWILARFLLLWSLLKRSPHRLPMRSMP
jgi:ubiquinone biosynthesis protein